MASDLKSLAIITNTLPPYRVPLFNAIARDFKLKVFVVERFLLDRYWNVSTDNLKFGLYYFSNLTLGHGKQSIVIPTNLMYLLSLFRPHAVIAGGTWRTSPAVLQAAFYARIRGIPFLLWSGDFENPFYQKREVTSWVFRVKKYLYNSYLRMIAKSCSAAIAYSNRSKNYLVRLGLSPESVFVGGQSVFPNMLPEASADRHRFGIPKRAVAVLFVGYLTERKGVSYLIQAFMAEKSCDSVLVIAGDGAEKRRMEYLARQDPRIIFTGYVDGEAKGALYRSCDVFVLPTLYDPWGQVVFEAMIAGLPIIITEAAGCANELVIHGENGYIVPAYDVKALQSAISSLCHDEALRARMGQASLNRVRSYNIDKSKILFRKAVEYALNIT